MELQPSEINIHTTNTVRILNGDEDNSIPDRAFRGYSSLESVHIEDGANVRTIGESAFNECSSLLSINIPIGVTRIGQSAFYGCKLLQSIDIPIGIKTIGMFAFRDCSSLPPICGTGRNENEKIHFHLICIISYYYSKILCVFGHMPHDDGQNSTILVNLQLFWL